MDWNSSHDNSVEVVEDERDPIGGRLSATLAVDASPEDLAEDRDGDGRHDETQNNPAPEKGSSGKGLVK